MSANSLAVNQMLCYLYIFGAWWPAKQRDNIWIPKTLDHLCKQWAFVLGCVVRVRWLVKYFTDSFGHFGCVCLYCKDTVADPGFLRWGVKPRWGRQSTIWQNVAKKTAWTWNKLDRKRGRAFLAPLRSATVADLTFEAVLGEGSCFEAFNVMPGY